jgi:heme/copper-type cytochrome/quinol oxidase subunit 1
MRSIDRVIGYRCSIYVILGHGIICLNFKWFWGDPIVYIWGLLRKQKQKT